ncbi:MAG: GNAT family N-acetyltransferase [Actinophytocola sp.]|uniref:GNAT family N-acetyltransferase n=1 Tax=Actinophytocola sp. TaxID=1872138 RepID=UPI003C773143
MTTTAPRAPAGTSQSGRLTLRSWRVDDAQAAADIYGNPDVTGWLSPAMDPVRDLATMRVLLQQWIAEDARLAAPAGRWAIERSADRHVIGGAMLLPLPPGDEDLEVGWQLTPAACGHGYADEAMFMLASWAFQHDVDEVFAVVRPENTRTTATVRKNGMHWVGETSKYLGLDLQVFRLRQADLDRSAPTAHRPPEQSDQAGAR